MGNRCAKKKMHQNKEVRKTDPQSSRGGCGCLDGEGQKALSLQEDREGGKRGRGQTNVYKIIPITTDKIPAFLLEKDKGILSRIK